MRIIRVLVALITLVVILLPQIALASAEVKKSNETKINFELKNNLIIKNGVVSGRYEILAGAPENFEGYSREKTEEEIKREKALDRYAEKRKAANYPKGKFTINASAYTAAADECGKSDGITASGLKVREKETLACPPSFPFGTKIRIDGMGTYVCQDRGGAIKGNKVDIYMETKKEAFAFGRRNLLAEVIL
jgi:3D (Asp-Asp-Asp) domain-containing protein